MNNTNFETLYKNVQRNKVEIDDAKRMMYNNNKTALQAIESKKSESVTHGALIFDIYGNDFRFRSKTSHKSININAVDRTIQNINKMELDKGVIAGISDEQGDDSTIAISQKGAKELVSKHDHDDKYALIDHTHDDVYASIDYINVINERLSGEIYNHNHDGTYTSYDEGQRISNSLHSLTEFLNDLVRMNGNYESYLSLAAPEFIENNVKLSEKYALKNHTHEILDHTHTEFGNLTIGCMNIADIGNSTTSLTNSNELRLKIHHSKWGNGVYKWINCGGWGYPFFISNHSTTSDGPDSNSIVFSVNNDGNVSCSAINGFAIGLSNTQSFIPTTSPTGVMEIGRYIDFHSQSSGDYDVRLEASGKTLKIYNPSTSNEPDLEVSHLDCTEYYGNSIQCQTMKSTDITCDTLNGINFPALTGSYQPSMPYFAVVRSEGTMEIGTRIDFHNVGSTRDYDFRLYGSGHDLKLQTPDGNTETINQTITHNAPLTESIDNYEIGCPVFMSGKVYNYDLKTHRYVEGNRTSDNCIPSVRSSGTYKEFIGVCIFRHHKGESTTVGDVIKSDVVVNEDTIDFATHGDFVFKVDDSSKYNIGDTVLFDGTVLDDDIPLTNKINKSIAGRVTGIIDDETVALFKS